MSQFTHFDAAGSAHMVDVGAKPVTNRLARASARVVMQPATLILVRNGGSKKGDVLAVARLAGIMAAKRTGDLIPLCHPLPLDGVTVDFAFSDEHTLGIEAVVRCTGRTGVEMEALTAASVAAHFSIRLFVVTCCGCLRRRCGPFCSRSCGSFPPAGRG